MLKYHNIRRFDNMPFEEYLENTQDGDRNYSHSFLKTEVAGQSPLFVASQKVKLGKLVDSILMSPDEVNPAENPEMFKQACKIASAIKAKFGTLIPSFVPQVSYTAQLSYKGLVMNVCGRLDWLLPQRAVIDLKVTDAKTDKEFTKIIEFMGYGNQMQGYRGLAGVSASYLLPYSVTARCCLSVVKMEYSPDAAEWWQNAVIKFGK